MFNFFNDTYETQLHLEVDAKTMIQTIINFEQSKHCQEVYYDEARGEFLIKGRNFSIVIESQIQARKCTLQLKSYCKWRCNYPKTYMIGFVEYLNASMIAV